MMRNWYRQRRSLQAWRSVDHVAASLALARLTPLRPCTRRKPTPAPAPQYVYSDSHFHLTNYVQEGTDIHDYLKMMDGVVKRSTVFGLPLQQMWQYGNTGDFAPWYYLQTDAPLYYYSFTDALHRDGLPFARAGAAAAARPDDHGLQSCGHVRGRPHPSGAADVPGGVLRYRRVLHPQGVRVVQDRRRPGLRSATRRCIASWISRARSASSRSCTTTSTCHSPSPDRIPTSWSR